MQWRISRFLMPILLIAAGSINTASADDSRDTEVRHNFLAPSDRNLPEVSEELAVLTVNICNKRPNVFLQQIDIENTLSKQRYALQANAAQYPEKRVVVRNTITGIAMGHVEENGVVQHTLFMDLPAGRYQITGLRFVRDGVSQTYASVNDIQSLFFWYDDHDLLSYIGELNISFGDGFSRAPTLFATRSANQHVRDIRTRYAAVADSEFDDGNIWLQDPDGGALVGSKGEVLCRFSQDV